jgi:hypothetical protein
MKISKMIFVRDSFVVFLLLYAFFQKCSLIFVEVMTFSSFANGIDSRLSIN